MAQENPYLIEENPYLKKDEENPYLNIAPKPQQPLRSAAPTTQPTGEPTAAELEAASKPAMLTRRQFLGSEGKALDAARAKQQEVAPSLTSTQPVKPRDFSAVDAAVEKLTPKPKAQAFPVMTESDKLFGPMPKPIQPMGGRNVGLTPETAAKSPEIVSLSREYWDMRFPNLPKPKSDVELMKAIMMHHVCVHTARFHRVFGLRTQHHSNVQWKLRLVRYKRKCPRMFSKL
jgi:hypothetical protein